MHRSLFLRLLPWPLAFLMVAVHPAAADDDRPFGLTARVPWTTSRVVGTPEPPPPYTVERMFPNLTFDQPVYIAQEPGTDRFLVAEVSGKIYAFTADTPANDARELFLDAGRQLYAFSFHPAYEQNGYVFTFSPRPRNSAAADDGTEPPPAFSRVSRFEATGADPRRCSAETEHVIVQWPAGGHNGGEAIIGPDGYLYVSTGDGTSGSDLNNTGQGVDDLFAVIMRLDVDGTEGNQAYAIPPDNPFVGFPEARPEIWAFGFRNPWRMSFDSRTGRLWVGDVGQDLWEMIWRVERGGNYGWSVQEGSHPFHPYKTAGPGPILPPVVEHHHTECRSITGGYVYREDLFPELKGTYFYGDYEYGMIWGVDAELPDDATKPRTPRVLANTALRIASFGVSRGGEILVVDHASGEIYRLVRARRETPRHAFPRRLSETGLFESVADHQVAPGVIPFAVNTPQWIDRATKQRFLALPGDTKIRFVERSTDANTWGLADGSVVIETLSLDMETGRPDSRRRIETRMLVKQENHWLGYSYLWNEAQTDAELVPAGGRDLRLRIRDPSDPAGGRDQEWHIPSRNECMVCHSRAAGFLLGLRTEQMNRTYDYGSVVDHQLRAFDHIKLFQTPLEKDPAQYDALPDAYDSDAPLDARARAYLHVNCSVCHVPDGGGNAKIQLNSFQPLEETKLVERPMHGTFGLDRAQIITPGDPYASVLFYRLFKWGRGRMPHVGSQVHDERGIDLIYQWIAHLQPPDGNGPASLVPLEGGTAAQQAAWLDEQFSTTRGALRVANAVRMGRAPAALAQQAIARGAAHENPDVRDLFERFLPPDQRTRRLGNVISTADILQLEGDPERGRRFFFSGHAAQCKNCHRIGGQGGTLGPELDQVGKKYKPHELLESLVYPSRKIEDRYRAQVLLTTSGKVYTGIVAEQSDEQVVLNVFREGKTETLRIDAREVDELIPQPKSLMPDGLLRDLTARQAADLLAFLATLKAGPASP